MRDLKPITSHPATIPNFNLSTTPSPFFRETEEDPSNGPCPPYPQAEGRGAIAHQLSKTLVFWAKSQLLLARGLGR